MSYPSTLRRLTLSAGLIASAFACAAPAMADSSMPSALTRGASVSGSVTNMLNGSQAMTYTLAGDGSSVSLNATFTNVGDPTLNQSAFVNVWGPLGSVASANPNVAAGIASLAFPTIAGQSYTVQIIAYPPVQQSNFTLTAN